MRLFTGIELPGNINDTLSRLIEALRPTAHLKWTPAYNLHLTTKFIGEWPEERLPDLLEGLKPLGTRSPIPVTIQGIGWFPNPHNPRILWAGVKAAPELAKLASDTDEATGHLGVARETKPFSPHLTLARIRNVVPLSQVRQTIAQLPTVDFGEFTAEKFHLYLSKPGPSGSIYTKLADIPFQPE